MQQRLVRRAATKQLRGVGFDRRPFVNPSLPVVNPFFACLTIEAQQGFDAAFLSIPSVNAENGCACDRAIRVRKPVVIPDVDLDDDREAAAQAEYTSVVSLPLIDKADQIVLPLIDKADQIVGVMSLHRLTAWMGEADIETLRSAAEFAAEAITRHHQG